MLSGQLPKASSSHGIWQVSHHSVSLKNIKYPSVPLVVHCGTQDALVHSVGMVELYQFLNDYS